MKNRNPMTGIYGRLSEIGLSKRYVKKVAFPEWWGDEIAQTPAGYAQALTLISRNLRIDIRSLQEEDAKPQLCHTLTVLNKSAQGASGEKFLWAQRLG